MTVRGTVTDASTGAVLEGVLVSLEWTVNDSASHSASQHIDASTSASGEYTIETKLKEVVCSTLYLFFAEPGYRATRRFPDCKGGTQLFDAALEPN